MRQSLRRTQRVVAVRLGAEREARAALDARLEESRADRAHYAELVAELRKQLELRRDEIHALEQLRERAAPAADAALAAARADAQAERERAARLAADAERLRAELAAVRAASPPPPQTPVRDTLRHQRGPSNASSVVTSATSVASAEPEPAEQDIPEWVGRPGAAPLALPAHMHNVDPEVADAILQCMIGEYMYKYARRGLFGGAEKRHRRYFFINPYNRTIHWTERDPSTTPGGKSKTAHLEQVALADDNNHQPPGLYCQSIVIGTGRRELKITAPNKARHRLWCTALGYLLQGSEHLPGSAHSPRVTIPLELGARQGADGSVSRDRATITRHSSYGDSLSPSRTLQARPLTRSGTTTVRASPVFSVLNDPSEPHGVPARAARSSRRAAPEVRSAFLAESPSEHTGTARSRLSFSFRK